MTQMTQITQMTQMTWLGRRERRGAKEGRGLGGTFPGEIRR